MSGFDPDQHNDEELEAIRARIEELIERQRAKQRAVRRTGGYR